MILILYFIFIWLLEFGCHKELFLYGNEHFIHLHESVIKGKYKLAKCLLDKLSSKAKTNDENFRRVQSYLQDQQFFNLRFFIHPIFGFEFFLCLFYFCLVI